MPTIRSPAAAADQPTHGLARAIFHHVAPTASRQATPEVAAEGVCAAVGPDAIAEVGFEILLVLLLLLTLMMILLLKLLPAVASIVGGDARRLEAIAEGGLEMLLLLLLPRGPAGASSPNDSSIPQSILFAERPVECAF
jgi:hypothetical protein